MQLKKWAIAVACIAILVWWKNKNSHEEPTIKAVDMTNIMPWWGLNYFALLEMFKLQQPFEVLGSAYVNSDGEIALNAKLISRMNLRRDRSTVNSTVGVYWTQLTESLHQLREIRRHTFDQEAFSSVYGYDSSQPHRYELFAEVPVEFIVKPASQYIIFSHIYHASDKPSPYYTHNCFEFHATLLDVEHDGTLKISEDQEELSKARTVMMTKTTVQLFDNATSVTPSGDGNFIMAVNASITMNYFMDEPTIRIVANLTSPSNKTFFNTVEVTESFEGQENDLRIPLAFVIEQGKRYRLSVSAHSRHGICGEHQADYQAGIFNVTSEGKLVPYHAHLNISRIFG